MQFKTVIKFAALFLSATLFIGGCSAPVVFVNGSSETTATYLNGAYISGVPVTGTEKPVESIPTQTTTGGKNTDETSDTSPKPQTPANSRSQEQSVPETPKQTMKSEVNSDIPTVDDGYDVPKTSVTVTETTTTTQTVTKPPQTDTPTKEDVTDYPSELPQNSYTALNHKTVHGVWIWYSELYPILTGKTKSQFEMGIGEYYDNCLSLGINTVFVHVRPFGDALYKSDYYPWSEYCTGYIGVAPDYDPLEVMIEQAHKRNISFHAWVNPLRCYYYDDITQVSGNYLTRKWYNEKNGDYIVNVNNHWWLNPAYDEVRELVALGAAEIVSKYDVDGVHIDDYFYPTTDLSFDSIAFSASGYSSLEQFRLDNCTKMVDEMYKAVKAHNPTALFGVSAQGNVTNNREQLYADVEKWSSERGYVDYMAPQIYYGFENSGQPFADVVEQWDEMLAGTGKELIPGLAVYKIGTEDTWAGSGKYEWINDTEILKRQIEKSRTANAYAGVILYSYQFIFTPDSSISSAVQKEIAAIKPLLV